MNRGGLYTDRAVAARRSGGDPLPWFERGRADLDAGLRIKGDSAPSLDTRGRLFIEWGIWRINAGSGAVEWLELAIADCEAAIAANPRFHFSHQNLGIACRARAETERRAGKPQAAWLERAVGHARDGIRLAPARVASWVELAKTAMRWAAALQAEGGDPVPAWRAAVEGATGALQGAPEDPRVLELRASAYGLLFRSLGKAADCDAALADYDAVVRLRPGEWRALAAAGSLCAAAERWTEAVRRFEAALRLQPGHAQLQQALAAARARAR
jgi:tetratricopeptide (TPR) repeat protein